MYRYYITKLNQHGIMEYPPLPIPDTVGHYGQNGIAFEGICGHFYGFVEYEKELPASDVAVFNLVPGPSPSYYPIDEETARRAHEMMSFRDYACPSPGELAGRRPPQMSVKAVFLYCPLL